MIGTLEDEWLNFSDGLEVHPHLKWAYYAGAWAALIALTECGLLSPASADAQAVMNDVLGSLRMLDPDVQD